MSRLAKQEAELADTKALARADLPGLTLDEKRAHLRVLDLLEELDALLARAEQAEAERDTLLDILERLHSVQDGCPLHKYNTAWVKAMEDAQTVFDRAGGGA